MDRDKSTIDKLRGSENYHAWKYAITSLLEMHDLELSIAESESDPNTSTEEDATKLKKAKAKINLSIDPSLYVHIEDCKTALEIWNRLQTMFEDKGLSRRIGLLRSLISTTLENSESMTAYITKIIGTAHKLRSIGFDISEEYVGSFLLAGLPDQFQPFIMGMESSGAKITGDTIKTRLFEMNTKDNDSNHAFIGSKKKTFKPNQSTTKCDECGKNGHTTARCFKLRAKKKRQSTDNTTNNAFSAVTLCGDEKSNYDTFFLDSGASQHMVSNENWLTNVRSSATKSICIANNQQLKVNGVGDLMLKINGKDIEVKNVLCVTGLAANLLSVSQITEKGNKLQFHRNGCTIKNTNDEKIAYARLIDGIYQLSAKVPKAFAAKSIVKENIISWHRKMGHLNFQRVALMNNTVNGVSFEKKQSENILPNLH